METIDDGLTINSNMVTDGFEMVFHWGYSYSNCLVEAPQQLTTFSLAVSTFIRWCGATEAESFSLWT